MATTYKMAGLKVPAGVSEVKEMDVSSYLNDIHDMQPLDYVELDDGRKFLVLEFEISLDANPKAFLTMKLPPTAH